MNSKKSLLIMIVALAVLISGAAVLYTQLGDGWDPDRLSVQGDADLSQDETGTQPGKMMAPDFAVYDQGGNQVKLSDYFGKPIVLNFWASWCGPCKSEMPDFEEKFKAIGTDVQFLMVNMTSGRETLDSAKGFIAQQGYTFPVFYDTEEQAAIAYSVYSLPTTYFIDEEGYLVAQATGAINAQLLQRGIDMILDQ